MRTKDGIFFSPNYQFIDLNWDDQDDLIDAFEDRINGFYFEPAEKFKEKFDAFSKGLICLSIIDLLSKIETNSNDVGYRYEHWLKKNINNFDSPNPDDPQKTIAYRFYKEFRNILVHECLIENAGQFSYDYNIITCFIKDEDRHIMVINPQILLLSLQKSAKLFFEKLRSDLNSYNFFKDWMMEHFFQDFESSKRNKKGIYDDLGFCK